MRKRGGHLSIILFVILEFQLIAFDNYHYSKH
jgi:hypothetical protein